MSGPESGRRPHRASAGEPQPSTNPTTGGPAGAGGLPPSTSAGDPQPSTGPATGGPADAGGLPHRASRPRRPLLTVIVDGRASGAENMRRDLDLLERVVSGRAGALLRLYGFSPPCLSLGRLQGEDDVDTAACARDGVDIVRRPTGGRAVLHDEEVTYALVCSIADPVFGGTVAESCRRIHAAVAAGLRALGVATASREAGTGSARDAASGPAPAQLTSEAAGTTTGPGQLAQPPTGNHGAAVVPSASARPRGSSPAVNPDCFAEASAGELLDRFGRKLVGSAQARRADVLLQHGSILLEPSRATAYLRGTGGGRPSSDGLHSLLGGAIDPQVIVEALVRGFRAVAES